MHEHSKPVWTESLFDKRAYCEDNLLSLLSILLLYYSAAFSLYYCYVRLHIQMQASDANGGV